MPAPSVAAYTAKYSRFAACAQTVRSASAFFDKPVEFVLLDEDRALVVADVEGTSGQPRLAVASERALVSESDIAEGPGSTSVRVDTPVQLDACLTMRTELDRAGQLRLAAFAAELGAAIAEREERAEQLHGFEAAVLAGLRDAVLVLDHDLTIRWSNDGVVTLLGWGPQELIGESVAKLVHPEDAIRAAEAAASLAGGHRISRLNVRVSDAFGNWVPVSITGIDHSADPAIGGLVLSMRNDERELESERALDEIRRVSTTILKNLHEAVIAIDEVGAITIINDAARRLFGVAHDVAPGSVSIDDIQLCNRENDALAPECHPLRPRPIWVDQELRVVTPLGLHHVSVTRNEVQLDDGHFGIIVTFHDTTQARADARELRNRALHDQLTGLANRRHVSEQLMELKMAESSETLAACLIGIDKFKNVNDIHGHRVGDAVLKETASRLRGQIRDLDILSRPGGDEFLLILVNPTDERTAIDVAERIQTIFDRPFEVEGNRLHLTTSVGIAFQHAGTLDDERLLQQADIALYAAKDQGGDCIEIFDEKLATVVAREQSQRNMVRDALDNDRLVMHFQAIVDGGGATIGVEALARCEDDGGAVVMPAGFMDAIDGTNLMVRLDREGFEQSCVLAAILKSNPSTAHMWVAANFSAMTLAQSDFADEVLRVIEKVGIDPSSICVEVTETAAFEPGESSINALNKLHRAGVRIALDDFGTGYSSLSHLRDLPLTTVKIDRSFTSELHHHGTERAIASAVRDIAESVGFTVVAEGVETAADREAVQDIGVDSMQGWYFARAVPKAELLINLQINAGEVRA